MFRSKPKHPNHSLRHAQESPAGDARPRRPPMPSTGTVISSTRADVSESGTATLRVPVGEDPRQVRVVVGPRLEQVGVSLR